MTIRSPALPFVLALLIAVPAAAREFVPLSDLAHIHGVAFQGSALLLATHHGVFAVEAGGLAKLISADQNDYMGFTAHPEVSGLLLASGHPEGGGNLGVIASSDGGVSWAQLSPGEGGPVDFHAIAASRADPDVLYGLYDAIQISRDRGATWAVSGDDPYRTIDIAASAAEVGTLYAGTMAGLQVSYDFGKSWTAASGPLEPATLTEIAPTGELLVYFAPSGLYRGTGETFEPVGVAPDILLHLAVDPADAQRLVAVTQASALLESRDGGRSWAPLQ